MKIFQTYSQEKGKYKINNALFWDYNLDSFNWQKYRRTVAERVIALGRLSDWYAAFDLYGGIRGFRKIAKEEVIDLTPRDLDFMCKALNINKTETECYRRAQLRNQHLNS